MTLLDSAVAAEMDTMPQVWMYHSIEPCQEDPFQVTVSPERFAKQMEWLRRRGLRGVAMSELLEAHRQGDDSGLVGLTFDDGYRDFITTALPVLRWHGFTSTVFVLAGRLCGQNEWSRPGPNKPLLTGEEVRSIAEAGMEIGSHGLQHISLLEAGDERLRAETSQSRSILEGLIGAPVRGFAYPYGHLDDRVVQSAVAAGYRYACAVEPGPLIGRQAIPRTLVHDRDTSPRLHAKRIVSKVTVGTRRGVARYRKGY